LLPGDRKGEEKKGKNAVFKGKSLKRVYVKASLGLLYKLVMLRHEVYKIMLFLYSTDTGKGTSDVLYYARNSA
jgi:hypothetical protein